MDMNKHEILEQKLCKELEHISDKLTAGEMSPQDLDRIDKIYHALKCLATYKAMKEAAPYEEGLSGYYPRNGGYGMSGQHSYDAGYREGYSEAQSQMHSGRYPIPYYGPRNW